MWTPTCKYRWGASIVLAILALGLIGQTQLQPLRQKNQRIRETLLQLQQKLTEQTHTLNIKHSKHNRSYLSTTNKIAVFAQQYKLNIMHLESDASNFQISLSGEFKNILAFLNTACDQKWLRLQKIYLANKPNLKLTVYWEEKHG